MLENAGFIRKQNPLPKNLYVKNEVMIYFQYIILLLIQDNTSNKVSLSLRNEFFFYFFGIINIQLPIKTYEV